MARSSRKIGNLRILVNAPELELGSICDLEAWEDSRNFRAPLFWALIVNLGCEAAAACCRPACQYKAEVKMLIKGRCAAYLCGGSGENKEVSNGRQFSIDNFRTHRHIDAGRSVVPELLLVDF